VTDTRRAMTDDELRAACAATRRHCTYTVASGMASCGVCALCSTAAVALAEIDARRDLEELLTVASRWVKDEQDEDDAGDPLGGCGLHYPSLVTGRCSCCDLLRTVKAIKARRGKGGAP